MEKIIEEVVILAIGWYVTGRFIAAMDDDEGSLPTSVRAIAWVIGLVAAAIGWWNLGATISLAFMLIVVLVIAKVQDNAEDKKAIKNIGLTLGAPATVAIIANVVMGFNWPMLLWLLAPIGYYTILIMYGWRISPEQKEGPKKEEEPFGLQLAATIILTILAIISVLFAKAKGVI